MSVSFNFWIYCSCDGHIFHHQQRIGNLLWLFVYSGSCMKENIVTCRNWLHVFIHFQISFFSTEQCDLQKLWYWSQPVHDKNKINVFFGWSTSFYNCAFTFPQLIKVFFIFFTEIIQSAVDGCRIISVCSIYLRLHVYFWQ